MSQQLHKRFSDDQVKAILAKYTHKEMGAKEAITYLGISRARFYQIVNEYDRSITKPYPCRRLLLAQKSTGTGNRSRQRKFITVKSRRYTLYHPKQKERLSGRINGYRIMW